MELKQRKDLELALSTWESGENEINTEFPLAVRLAGVAVICASIWAAITI
ncbi:hypothetical protein [Vibrio alginolyticus]|nr:hypothetical protein [Vibrio alginolyticus]CAH7184675.1 hypothetical protein VCHA51O444_10550 [Vibrio chagasii]CAH7353688.1 hypothetical protein VCHA53O474_30358 [Vibrio chagasii]